DQRFRHDGPAGGNQDRVVRSIRVPAHGSIKTLYRSIVYPKLSYTRLGLAGEFADALDGINRSGKPGQDGGLIARARPNLQDAAVFIKLEQLRHAGDDKRLGNGLIECDRKRVISVSSTPQGLWHKNMPRYGTHCFQHLLVTDPVTFLQALDHSRA